MKRRGFLKGFVAVGSCALCAELAAASENKVRWSYSGDRGSEHWGKLSGDFRACSVGSQQSPVNLRDAIAADLKPIDLQWKKSSGTMINNGHTIQIDVERGNTLARDGKTFDLLQFHFHAPSEHQIDGQSFPMEMHFVHRHAKTGELVVVGVFLSEGGPRGLFGAMATAFPTESGQKLELVNIDLMAFLPSNMTYFTYAGSLTTPPCSEIVTWLVLTTPLAVDRRDIERFEWIYNGNARPIEPLNSRLILKSG